MAPVPGVRFYSKSFALVNYLHLSRLATKTDRLPQMREYLRLFGEGMESEAAFEQAFAMKVGLMERELHKFLTRSMRPVLQLPMQAFERDGTYRRRAVPTAEIAYRLGYLIVLASPVTARALFEHEGLHAHQCALSRGGGRQLSGRTELRACTQRDDDRAWGSHRTTPSCCRRSRTC